MASNDLVPPELPKQEILPSDDPFNQQTPTETSSVENQSDIPVKETADLGQQTQLLGKWEKLLGFDKPKKLPVQEIPPSGDSHQENSSQKNPSDALVKQTAYDEKAWVYETFENDPLEHQRIRLIKQNCELKASLYSLASMYDIARSNCKKADVDTEKMLQMIKHGENFKFLLDPNWIKIERRSLLEENKIWRENREALDANLKKLISMLKIASSLDATELDEFERHMGKLTGDRRALDANMEKLAMVLKIASDTSTLGEQTIAEELKPYAAEIDKITKAFRDKVESQVGILKGNVRALDANLKNLTMMLNAETMAEEIQPYAAELEENTNSIRSKQFETVKLPLAATLKKKRFWAWLSAATTVVAAASVAYVAGQYSKSIRLQSSRTKAANRITSADDGAN